MIDFSQPGRSQQFIGGQRIDCFAPATPSPHGHTIIFLHDLSTSPGGGEQRTPGIAEYPQLQAALEAAGLYVVAPQSGHSWWLDKIVPAFDERVTPFQFVAEQLLPAIRQVQSEQTRIGVLGVGMGGQGALRLAYLRPNDFPIAAAIAPDIDYQRHIRLGDEVLFQIYGQTESARQDTVTLHIHPLNWPRNQWYCADPSDYWRFEGADRLKMKLGSLGVPFEFDLETSVQTPVDGPLVDYANRMANAAVEFLLERLEKERLRVV